MKRSVMDAFRRLASTAPDLLTLKTKKDTLTVRHDVEEFAKPEFLITPQMPGLGKHSFDHALRFVPMSA
jgi:hypothetical protein